MPLLVLHSFKAKLLHRTCAGCKADGQPVALESCELGTVSVFENKNMIELSKCQKLFCAALAQAACLRSRKRLY